MSWADITKDYSQISTIKVTRTSSYYVNFKITAGFSTNSSASSSSLPTFTKSGEVTTTATTATITLDSGSDYLSYGQHYYAYSYVTANGNTTRQDKKDYGYYVAVHVTLTFNANGGSGAPSSVESVWKTTGTGRIYKHIIPNTVPTRSGYVFKGWATSKTSTVAAYQPGDDVEIEHPSSAPLVTLYAVWEKEVTVPPVRVKVGGAWKTPTAVKVKVNGAWKDATAVYVKSGGSWKQAT